MLSIVNLNIQSFADYDFNIGTRMYLGTGFDTLSNITKGRNCVTYENLSAVTSAVDGKNYSLRLIENYQDLAKHLGVDVAASIQSFDGRGGGRASFLSERSVNDYSVYFLIKGKVLNPLQYPLNAVLNPAFLELATKNPAGFRQACGDTFVSGVQSGGELFALITIQTRTETEAEQLRVDIRAAEGEFEGSASLIEKMNKITKKRIMQVDFSQVGGSSEDFPMSIRELNSYLKKFPELIKTNPTYTNAVVSPYVELTNFPRNSIQFEQKVQEQVLSQIGSYRYLLLRYINNIDYIMNHLEEFIDPNILILVNERENAIDLLNNLTDLARSCMDFADSKNCAYSKKTPVLTELPKRKKNLPSLECVEKRAKICGIETYNVKPNPLCGIASFNEQTDEKCGILLFAEKENEACGVNQYKEGTDSSICGTHDGAEYICGFKYACDFFGCGQRPNYCKKQEPNTCRSPQFGIESYKKCRTLENGGEKFKSCQLAEFGVKEYKACELAENGVATYKICSVMENEEGARLCPTL